MQPRSQTEWAKHLVLQAREAHLPAVHVSIAPGRDRCEGYAGLDCCRCLPQCGAAPCRWCQDQLTACQVASAKFELAQDACCRHPVEESNSARAAYIPPARLLKDRTTATAFAEELEATLTGVLWNASVAPRTQGHIQPNHMKDSPDAGQSSLQLPRALHDARVGTTHLKSRKSVQTSERRT